MKSMFKTFDVAFCWTPTFVSIGDDSINSRAKYLFLCSGQVQTIPAPEHCRQPFLQKIRVSESRNRPKMQDQIDGSQCG